MSTEEELDNAPEELEEASYEDSFDEWVTGEAPEKEEYQPEDESEVEDSAYDEPEGDQGDEAESVQTPDEPEPELSARELQEQLQALQNENQTWQQRYRSHDGRVTSMRQQIDQLHAELEKRASSPTSQESAAAPSSKELEQFKEDYPDIADAVDRLVNHRLGSQQEKLQEQLALLDNRFNQTIQPMREAESQRSKEAQISALQSQHPDFVQIVQSQDFQDWLEVQPEPVKQMYYSDSADEASWMLDSFKRVKQGQQPAVQEDQQPAENPNQRKLQEARNPRGRRAAPQTGVPDDFDSAFEYYANQK